MENYDAKSSVQDEQVGDTGRISETNDKQVESEHIIEKEQTGKKEPLTSESEGNTTDPVAHPEAVSDGEAVVEKVKKQTRKKKTPQVDIPAEIPGPSFLQSIILPDPVSLAAGHPGVRAAFSKSKAGDKEKAGPGKSKVKAEGKKGKEADTSVEEMGIEPVDYSRNTKAELVEILKILLETKPVHDIRDDVENIKVNFYKKHKADNEKLRKKFAEEGNPIEEFQPPADMLEENLKELLKTFRFLRSEYSRQFEKIKQENLKKKYEVIEKIKDLVDRKESLNKTFQEFRDLQAQWKEIGMVPQGELKNLWETYHHHVEMFYDYIKINQELRDLDFRKNLEMKTSLCEKAEVLNEEKNIVSAFKALQKLHAQWREIGPVPPENRTEIWERFREATAVINKQHQEFFVNLKTTQKHNLEQKTRLCERVEEILGQEISKPRDWENKSREIIGIQKEWKSIGFSPRKQNNRIYKRFRDACDQFFKKKREYYSEHKEVLKSNYQLKTELCEQAEALKTSTDWKKTTDDLIALQEKWKETGPVPRKQADLVWKRFRAACDEFFNKKSSHYSNIDQVYEKNLEQKEKLIEQIGQFHPTGNPEKDSEFLSELQRQWNDIGFVPIEKKDEIMQRYRNAINKQFDHLNIDEPKKRMLKFRTRIESVKDNRRSTQKIMQERDKFIVKMKQLESDIVVWENNVGFFAKSKTADSMIKEVEAKIEKAKMELKILEEKVRMIDRMEQEE